MIRNTYIFFLIVVSLVISCANGNSEKESSIKQVQKKLVCDTLKEKNIDTINKLIDYTLRDELLSLIFDNDTSGYRKFNFSVNQENQLNFLFNDQVYQAFTSPESVSMFNDGNFNYLNNQGLVVVINHGIKNKEWLDLVDLLLDLKKRRDNTRKLFLIKPGFIVAILESYSLLVFINHCSERSNFEIVATFLKGQNDVLRLEVSRCGFN